MEKRREFERRPCVSGFCAQATQKKCGPSTCGTRDLRCNSDVPPILAGDEDICGFDVATDNSLLMGRIQSRRDLNGKVEQLREFKRGFPWSDCDD